MKFGDNLKKLRKLKNFSQEDLAERVEVSRQSISKWETGDAYPSMNNILELCNIFHCHINDLVNNSIVDVDSLDEEIRRNVVKFKRVQQSKMKGLSKAIMVMAKIGKIACLVSVPVVVLSMIILGIVSSNVDIVDNKITWKDNDVVEIVEEDDKILLKIDDYTVADTKSRSEIIRVKDLLQNNSKTSIIIYVETGFAFLVVVLIMTIMIFKALENLFTNINRGDTPFTLENVGYIKKVAYLMIAVTVLPDFVGAIFEMILNVDLNIGFEMFSLIEILFLFSIAYIFQYGYEIQLDSKGKIYGEEDE